MPRVTQTPLPSRGLALRDSVADASQPLFAEVWLGLGLGSELGLGLGWG